MQKTIVPLFIVFTIHLMLFPLNTFAADTTRMSLPEGAIARLGKGILNEIAYSPDGKYLAVAASIGVWIYDMETYQEVALLTEFDSGPISSVDFSPDGNTIISGNEDGTVSVWNALTGEQSELPTGY